MSFPTPVTKCSRVYKLEQSANAYAPFFFSGVSVLVGVSGGRTIWIAAERAGAGAAMAGCSRVGSGYGDQEGEWAINRGRVAVVDKGREKRARLLERKRQTGSQEPTWARPKAATVVVTWGGKQDSDSEGGRVVFGMEKSEGVCKRQMDERWKRMRGRE